MSEPSTRKCYGCGGELRDGMRFCVRCGTDNFDADAGRLASAQCDIETTERKGKLERFVHWWRYLMSGVRR